MAFREVRGLGRGAFGRVYLAVDDDNGTQCAIKEVLDPAADLERFEREIRILVEQIRNIYVVRILKFDLSSQRPWFAMEYCEAGSLRSWVGKSDWLTAATFLLHAAHGLLGIHQVGGFHRDIKPDNILLSFTHDKTGTIAKLADFGLARRPVTRGPGMTRTPAGTEGYMAPELDLPNAEFSTAADVYSLGIVGIELITGSKAPSALSGFHVPGALSALLVRMTLPYPFMRPSTADVIIALGQIVDSGRRGSPPVSAGPSPPPPPAGGIIPSSPPREGGGGWGWLAVIGAIAGAAALAIGNKKEWDDNVGRYRSPDGRFKK